MGVVKHNMSRTHVYKSYYCMMYRCYDKNHRSYKYYGGRKDNPIKVYERWHDINNFFLVDAVTLDGYDENSKITKTLDRIDPNGDYFPENCRWSDDYVQQNNRRNNVHVQWDGKDFTLAQLSREVG